MYHSDKIHSAKTDRAHGIYGSSVSRKNELTQYDSLYVKIGTLITEVMF